MINIDIPKEVTFDLPEGNFSARIENIKLFQKQTSKGIDDWVRILFGVEIPGMNHLNTIAGRNFKLDMHQGSDLRNFLGRLFGQRFFLNSSGQTFDMETLVGMDCEVQLEHYCGKNYDKPLVVVAEVVPPRNPKSLERIATGGAT